MNELKAIREALRLNQTEMAELYGAKQGVYQRWEAAPDSKAAREALDKAKVIYKRKTKKEWESPPAPSATLTRADFDAWRLWFAEGMDKLVKRVEALEDQARKAAPGGGAA